MPRKLAVAVLAVVSMTACAHQKPAVQAETPTPPPAPAAATLAAATPPAPPPPAALEFHCATDLECVSDELCSNGVCTAITPSLAACGLTRVHFDFDEAVIHPDEFTVLQRAARCIQANQPAHVLITGNADERGTVEYNLALGQRRAAAVSTYLETLGVPAKRLELVTYGKELPICTQHDDACWQRNRRAGLHPDGAPRDITAQVRADEHREKAARP
jgi:peptidoglycan-associated lipoprotein